jgi:hypothetical protein
MAEAEVQISGYVSAHTKRLVDEYVAVHGLKKGRLLEEALLHHLQALRELPLDVVVPTRVVVSLQGWKKIAARTRRPRRPTAAMRKLFARD